MSQFASPPTSVARAHGAFSGDALYPNISISQRSPFTHIVLASTHIVLTSTHIVIVAYLCIIVVIALGMFSRTHIVIYLACILPSGNLRNRFEPRLNAHIMAPYAHPCMTAPSALLQLRDQRPSTVRRRILTKGQMGSHHHRVRSHCKPHCDANEQRSTPAGCSLHRYLDSSCINEGGSSVT